MLVREDIVTRLFLGGIVILENVNRASSTSICIGACSGTLWRRLLSRDGHVRSGRSRSHRVFLLFNNNRITSTRMIKQKDGEEDNHGNSHDTGGSNQDPRERVSVRFVWIIISARALPGLPKWCQCSEEEVVVVEVVVGGSCVFLSAFPHKISVLWP